MKTVRIYINNKFEYVSLQEMLNMYHETPPEGWFKLIEEDIDKALNVKNEIEKIKYIESHQHIKYLKPNFDFKELMRFYQVIKDSKYSDILDDDILKYIALIYILGFFEIINYRLDINTPNLDNWLNSKNPFKYGYSDEELKDAYSMIDLISLKNGMNAIRKQLLKAQKKLY